MKMVAVSLTVEMPTAIAVLARNVSEDITRTAIEKHKERALTSLYVQLVIDTFLCSCFTVLLYTYWRFQSHDRLWTRILVSVAAVMAYGLTGYLLWIVQYFFVEHYGSFEPFFETAYFSWFPVLDAISGSIAQGYGVYRAWYLNGRKWGVIFVAMCLLLTSFVGAVWTKIQLDKHASLLAAVLSSKGPMIMWLASAMCANMLVSVAVLRGLIVHWDSWAPAENLVSRITRMALESQLLPSVVSCAFLIQLCVAPASLIGSTFYSIQSNVYLIGLLYTLNGRVTLIAAEVHGYNTSDPMNTTGLTSAELTELANRPSIQHTTGQADKMDRCVDEKEVGIPLQTLAGPMGLGVGGLRGRGRASSVALGANNSVFRPGAVSGLEAKQAVEHVDV